MKKNKKIIKFPVATVKKDSGVRPVETEILEAEFAEPEWPDIISAGLSRNPILTMNDFNRIIDENFPNFEIPGLKETREGYKIELELPRFDLADIKITLTDGNRTVNIEAYKRAGNFDYSHSQIYVLNSAVRDRYTSKLDKGVLYLEFKKI